MAIIHGNSDKAFPCINKKIDVMILSVIHRLDPLHVRLNAFNTIPP